MENKGYIVVNLLPYREKIKKQKTQQFFGVVILFAVAAFGFVLAGSGYLSVQESNQEARNKFIEKQNTELDKQIVEIGTLKETIAETLAKRRVVESLQVNRSDGVNILNELSVQMPEGIKLISVNQTGNKITIIGNTSSNSKISTYMTALEDTPVFKDAQILEIKKVADKAADKKTKSSSAFSESQFTLVVNMEREIVIEPESKSNNKNRKK